MNAREFVRNLIKLQPDHKYQHEVLSNLALYGTHVLKGSIPVSWPGGPPILGDIKTWAKEAVEAQHGMYAEASARAESKRAESKSALFGSALHAALEEHLKTEGWEQVHKGLFRIDVPGGWLYRFQASGGQHLMEFVPNPNKTIGLELAEES